MRPAVLLFMSLQLPGLVLSMSEAGGQESIAGRYPAFSVIELTFKGPEQGPGDTPARDVLFTVLFEHEESGARHLISGFWDGDGQGNPQGGVYRVRFCPTLPGRWRLAEVRSNRPSLNGQREGAFIDAETSELPGFWIVDARSPGRRWYMRSDGSHPYITGNTHYSFLSRIREDNLPVGTTIAEDVVRNAGYFKKLRFSLLADRYPHPDEKPFLDSQGKPSDDGRFSLRPNPGWFRRRADVAVQTAFEQDLIADLILCGPDTEEARSTLLSDGTEAGAAAYLRYVAARYGSYPNVWFCLCNEFDIKKPKYTAESIARLGGLLRSYLAYPAPLSVHSAPLTWPAAFDSLPEWADHLILQNKLRRLGQTADAIFGTWGGQPGRTPRLKPTINDELSYQGLGDKHTEQDTIEAFTGALLGGGYASTGWKPGNKTGHYFWGAFDPAEHTAADNLQWLREKVDESIPFWKLAPDVKGGPFRNLDENARCLSETGRAYLLGTNGACEGILAKLPEGSWRVRMLDVIEKREVKLADSARGEFLFDAPESRASLFHFQRVD